MRQLAITTLLLCGMVAFQTTFGDDDDDDGDLPPCDFIGQGLDGSCTIGPDTPEDPPTEAPDGCLIWYFYDDWEAIVGYACA